MWQTGSGDVALVSYAGTFDVPALAASPVAGTAEPVSGSGVIESCYVAAFTATLSPGTLSGGKQLTTTGFQGTVEYGGTVGDILASYPSGSPGANPGYWSWYGGYFTGTTSCAYTFDTWTYTLTSPTASPPPTPATFLSETGIYSTSTPTVTGDIIT